MNIILLICITLATTFLASSMNNLIAISKSANYFMEKAKTPDYIISSYDNGGNEELDNWLNTSKYINSYERDRSTVLSKDNIKIEKDVNIKDFEPLGYSLLEAQPKNYGKIIDENGEEINLKSGEIAFSLIDKNKNNLKIGDKILINLGDIKKEFTIKEFTKDAIFGSSMMDTKRILISEQDYAIFKSSKEASTISNYYIMSNDTTALAKEFNGITCNTINNFDKSMIKTTFTLQDDFKEIGIMKAIGLKNFDIKKIYLIKYLAITIIGTIIGLAVSFPFGNLLLNQSKGNILMESSSENILVNIACSIFIVLIVLLFCYTCTRKLNKFSAIDAIRNGSNGESFKGKPRLKLKKYKKINVPMFIALNDILCNFKRYAVLILTFSIGTMLIIIPVNTINTLKDGNIVRVFGFQYSDAFIQTDNMDKYTNETSKQKYLEDMEKIKKDFRDSGINTEIYGQVMYRLKFYTDDKDNAIQISAFQYINSDNSKLNVLNGKIKS